MKRPWPLYSLLLLLAASCGNALEGLHSEVIARAEHKAAKVRVQHVLIGFKGAQNFKGQRSQEDAILLATQLLERARKGEDFTELMKFSDDPGGGDYTMTTDSAPTPPATTRSGMVKAFGDIGWRLEPGEIGVTLYNEKDSPFGYHIIKRVE